MSRVRSDPSRARSEGSGIASESSGAESEGSGATSETSGVGSEGSGATSEASGAVSVSSGGGSEASGGGSEVSGTSSEVSGTASEVSGAASDCLHNCESARLGAELGLAGGIIPGLSCDVIPADAGIQAIGNDSRHYPRHPDARGRDGPSLRHRARSAGPGSSLWVPACAGTTGEGERRGWCRTSSLRRRRGMLLRGSALG